MPPPSEPGIEPPATPPGRAAGVGSQIAVATELPFVLVVSVAIGGLMGVGIDHLFHSSPWGLLLFGAMGLAAGVRDVIRRLGPSGSGKGTGTSSDG